MATTLLFYFLPTLLLSNLTHIMDNEYVLFFFSQQQLKKDGVGSNAHVNGMLYTECMSISAGPEWNHKKRFPDSRLIFVGHHSDVSFPPVKR